jgi:hypothetical protein
VQGDVHRICWRPSKRRKFEVTHSIIFLFYFLFFKYHVNHNYWFPFLWKSIWSIEAFFVWTTILGQISTLDILRKMNGLMVE